MTELLKLPLEVIKVDSSLQCRVNGLSEEHVKELQECPESWPPLVVVQQGNRYLLVEGFHRMAAAQNLELETVPVEVTDIPPDGDLKSLAFALNAVHGRPLSLTDRRAEAERLLRRNPQTSNMEVSRRTGLSPSTITSIREALEQESDIEPTPVRSGVGGRSYTASQSYQRQAGELPRPTGVDTFAPSHKPLGQAVNRKPSSSPARPS